MIPAGEFAYAKDGKIALTLFCLIWDDGHRLPIAWIALIITVIMAPIIAVGPHRFNKIAIRVIAYISRLMVFG